MTDKPNTGSSKNQNASNNQKQQSWDKSQQAQQSADNQAAQADAGDKSLSNKEQQLGSSKSSAQKSGSENR